MQKTLTVLGLSAALIVLGYAMSHAADLPYPEGPPPPVARPVGPPPVWREPPPRPQTRVAPPLPYYRDESTTIINNYVYTPSRWYPSRVYRDGTVWDGGPTSLPYSNQSREYTIRRDERLRCDPQFGCPW